MDTSELRAICHSFARLEFLKLSERRVQLAQAKEARLAKNDEPLRPFSPEECREGLAVMFGTADPEDQNPRQKSNDTEDNQINRAEEIPTDSAPNTPSTPPTSDEPCSAPPHAHAHEDKSENPMPNDQMFNDPQAEKCNPQPADRVL